MAGVQYDSYRRGALRRRPESVSALHFLLMFVAAGLLILSRVEHPVSATVEAQGRRIVEPALSAIAEAAQPVRRVVHNAARYLTVETELDRLERELATIRHLLERASDLEARNRELAKLARLVGDAPVDAVTVEVVAGRQGLFAQSVTIGAGREAGIRYGQPVFSGDGLFGRIVETGRGRARVLILNDNMSRIAVVVGESQRPALLVGDNSARPKLVYLEQDAAVTAGASVTTSGASGAFPRGILVGHVVVESDGARVQPLSSLVSGRYLTVMKHALPKAPGEVDGVDRDAGDGGEAGRQLTTAPGRARSEAVR